MTGAARSRVVMVLELATPPGWTVSLGRGLDEETGELCWFYTGPTELADVRRGLEAGPVRVLLPISWLLPTEAGGAMPD